MTFILPLARVRDADRPLVGAKAANLARLLRQGLPVPAGFCVSTDAWRAHLDGCGLRPRIEAALAEARKADGAGRAALLAGIRRLITESPAGDEVRQAVVAAHENLGERRLAVRSSATAEDLPGHSFAGLYDSVLGEAGPDRCVALVKQCWASLWTERAFEYRERNGVDHSSAAMAVLVQRLVPADCAGVAFTADPVSGRPDRIVVEAVPGLGDKLVSGEADPERAVLRRKGRAVIERRYRSVLTDKLARAVARLALASERALGRPQDVEWARAAGRVWLVQSRPITTLAGRSWDERQVWSNTNAAEVLPGVLTPLTWSTVGEYIGNLLGGILGRVGISVGEHPFTGNVAGRVYMNLNTFVGMVRRVPFVNRMGQDRMFGGAALSAEDRGRLELGSDDLPDIRVSSLKVLVKLPGFMLWILRHNPGRGRKWIAAARTAYHRHQRPDPGRFSEPELAARALAVLGQLGAGGDGLGYALAGMMYSTTLYDLCRRWLEDREGVLASRLLAGTGELQSAEAGIEMWRLARLASAEGLKPAVLSGRPWAELRAELVGSAAGRGFLERWDRFMHEHGHHGRGEMDIANPRWREQPDYVLEAVRNFIGAEGRTDPEADRRRHALERESLRAELAARLRNPVKRLVFGFVVRQAQLSAAIRENVKDAAIIIIADTRALVSELGGRLARRGVLASGEDIFFLRFEEIEPVVAGTAGFDVRRRVAERRADYERNRALEPPAVIIGRYDPKVHLADAFDPSARQLAGLAVSPGVVTGPARVILHSGEGQVRPGEILVAPFTDPGWTPYFIPAAGIVMDQGGLLSHGSIVAREYGIPAVVNVGPATRIIRNGQMVRVDGNRGTVTVLKDEVREMT